MTALKTAAPILGSANFAVSVELAAWHDGLQRVSSWGQWRIDTQDDSANETGGRNRAREAFQAAIAIRFLIHLVSVLGFETKTPRSHRRISIGRNDPDGGRRLMSPMLRGMSVSIKQNADVRECSQAAAPPCRRREPL